MLEPTFLCWGDIHKRYAQQSKQTPDIKDSTAYHISAMSDEILVIASVKTYVDIRNARSGQRIRQVVTEQDIECRAIAFAPDGQHFGVGLENGDILVYEAGLRLDFETRPIRVSSVEHSPVTSIVFSQGSILMGSSTLDNMVRTYRLNNLSDGCFKQYLKPLVQGKRSDPADIADLDL